MAFDISEEARREIGAMMDRMKPKLPRARWVRPESLHLTLRFLGSTEETLLPALHEGLAQVFSKRPPLALRLAGAGLFPTPGRGRVAWVGVEAERELLDLQAEVEEAAVAALGIAPEGRPYHPHLTLARCNPPWPRAAGKRFMESFAGPFGEAFRPPHGILYRSHLNPQGARYEVVETYPMGGPG